MPPLKFTVIENSRRIGNDLKEVWTTYFEQHPESEPSTMEKMRNLSILDHLGESQLFDQVKLPPWIGISIRPSSKIKYENSSIPGEELDSRSLTREAGDKMTPNAPRNIAPSNQTYQLLP
jgi:hypothetical protein